MKMTNCVEQIEHTTGIRLEFSRWTDSVQTVSRVLAEEELGSQGFSVQRHGPSTEVHLLPVQPKQALETLTSMHPRVSALEVVILGGPPPGRLLAMLLDGLEPGRLPFKAAYQVAIPGAKHPGVAVVTPDPRAVEGAIQDAKRSGSPARDPKAVEGALRE